MAGNRFFEGKKSISFCYDLFDNFTATDYPSNSVRITTAWMDLHSHYDHHGENEQERRGLTEAHARKKNVTILAAKPDTR